MTTHSDRSGGDDKSGTGFKRWQLTSAKLRLGSVIALGVVAGLIALVFIDWPTAILVGWIVAAVMFLLWTWMAIWPQDAADTARLATIEDPSRTGSDLVLLLAAVSSLITVAVVIFHAQQVGPFRTALGVVSVIASWAVVHTVYVLRYARMYYAAPAGGIDFNMDPDPAYRDFAYLGFVVGMTYQVADTNIKDSRIRSAVLGHGLISFVFGTVIIAVTINLIAGLSK